MSGFSYWAQLHPNKPALIMGDTSQVISFQKLWQRVDTLSRWLHQQGLQAGDNIIIMLENRAEVVFLALAAQQIGLYYSVLSTAVSSNDIQHIIQDNQTKLVFLSSNTFSQIEPLYKNQLLPLCFCVDDNPMGIPVLPEHLGDIPPLPSDPDRPVGRDLLYSSGTTGRAKGIWRPLPLSQAHFDAEISLWKKAFNFNENSVYLSTAPLYHAAPLRFSLRVLSIGGTVIILPRFNALLALETMQKWKVTHSQWVPAMFNRLLELPKAQQEQFRPAHLQFAIHAAAPCPIHIKQQMINWWGPILYEYYAGSESIGTTIINTEQWLKFPGSVGLPLSGSVHIVNDEGIELDANEIGHIYFSGGSPFKYVNDAQKTAQAFNEHGWATYGDIGYLNEDGYLFLSDRRSDLIVSGGVNIYPQEIEDVLVQHPAIADVAVIGVPDSYFGETPKALILLQADYPNNKQTAKDIAVFLAQSLAKIKLPKSVLFVSSLPRSDTGKMSRSRLKEDYKARAAEGYELRDLLRTTMA